MRECLQEMDFKSIEAALGGDLFGHMYLHAHEVIVQRPGKRPVMITAPLPHYMQHLIDYIQKPSM